MKWLDLVKALIIIAAWILRTKADNEARSAGVAETLAAALKDANDQIDKAKAARDRVRADLDVDPDRVRNTDEFERKD